jgi:putative flavoprotein involved in K+ transport
LRLNSPARYSSLPGLPFPGRPDRYLHRDEVATYLRHYATYFGLPLVTGAQVLDVERWGGLFRVLTGSHGDYLTRTVVAATGFFGHPYRPTLAGQAHYRGQMLHVADYQRPEPFRGQRIVVVGGGNAAVQVGIELAQVACVTLAVRRPIRYLPQSLMGQDIHFWLNLTGLDRTPWLNEQRLPVFDSGRYSAAIATGRPNQKPMFNHFTADGVVWSDGSPEAVDTVIFATGYRPHLPYLTGLGALDKTGHVLQRLGGPAHPGFDNPARRGSGCPECSDSSATLLSNSPASVDRLFFPHSFSVPNARLAFKGQRTGRLDCPDRSGSEAAVGKAKVVITAIGGPGHAPIARDRGRFLRLWPRGGPLFSALGVSTNLSTIGIPPRGFCFFKPTPN